MIRRNNAHLTLERYKLFSVSKTQESNTEKAKMDMFLSAGRQEGRLPSSWLNETELSRIRATKRYDTFVA